MYTGGSERLRIDTSGNVGIGTSSTGSARLNVNGGTGTSQTRFEVSTTEVQEVATNAAQSAYANRLADAAQHIWKITGTERMRIDSSGNVGIGTSSPAANIKLAVNGTIQIGTGTTSSAGCIFSNANFGMLFQALQASPGLADFIWLNSASTERMRIDSSGNLLVGTTDAWFSRKAVVDGTEGVAGIVSAVGSFPISAINQATSGDNTFQGFWTEAKASPSLRGTINYNRTAGLVAYNVTSDYRAKDIISPVLNSGEVIDSVPVYMGKMKDATQARPMFIAHETPDYAHTGEKDAVDKDGNPVYQQMDASSLVPVLWAEIQSLRKRVAQLESK
jgi:hypothetical protein